MKRQVKRRGTVLVWITVAMVMIIGVGALAIDVGHVYTVDAELQAAIDAAALAGAEGLTVGQDEAINRALTYAAKNNANGAPVNLDLADIELGLWNPVTRTFTSVPPSSGLMPDAVRVSTELSQANGSGVELFFAGALGLGETDVSASAVAFYRSRDILLVLDLSGSMNDDSELKHIDRLPQSAIESNIAQIYGELGSPQYGNMQFQPVPIGFDSNAQIQTALGLDAVPYPYPSGSWFDYFDYVKSSSALDNAGYRRQYGYLTLINYWFERQPMASQTPGLAATSQQPITAVKDAVRVFLNYIEQVETDDRIGLSMYTYEDGTAILEAGLTDDFAAIEQASRNRQAGHYDRFTNIGAGMQKAIRELDDNARIGTFKMIVLLTDGKANRPTNTTAGRQYALAQANVARDAGYPVITISLGADADVSLMDAIADRTGGIHFNVPGGQSVPALEQDLFDVFRQIADHRPLKLVE